MIFKLICMKILVHEFCRYIYTRLDNHHITVWYRFKCRKLLSNSFRKAGSPKYAIRNICSNLYPSLHKLMLLKSKREHLVDSNKHCCSIRASTCHSRCHRYEFIQLNLYSCIYTKFIHQKLRCLVYQVILISWKK